MRDALLLLGAGHPDYQFNLADPSTIHLEIQAYSDLEFGYHLAHWFCAWCTGPLFVSYFHLSVPRTGIITLSDLFYHCRFFFFSYTFN